MWRISDDFWDKWELLYDMFDRTQKWCTHTGAGHYADADMLPVGAVRQVYGEDNRTKFTKDEQYTMLTLWSIFRSPLMIGGELPKTDSFTLSLLTNTDILKMHKNSRHAHQLWRKEIDGAEHILWVAQNAEGGTYLAVFNAGDRDSVIDIPISDAEISGRFKLKELWSGKESEAEEIIKAEIAAHGTKAYLVL